MKDDLNPQERGALRRALTKAGKAGGKKRWAGSSKEQRSKAARAAARARWSKKRGDSKT